MLGQFGNIDDDIDPTKTYFCFNDGTFNCVSTGFNYLMKLVLSPHEKGVEDRLIAFLNTDKGKKQMNETNNCKYTPLMLSIKNIEDGASSKRITKILINHGCDLDIQDKFGFTVLMQAIIKNQCDIAKYLIKCCCNLNIQCSAGYTALMYAIRHNHIDIAEMLIGASCNMDLQQKYGYTALMIAVIFNRQSIAKTLIDAGCNLNIQDKDGKSAFDHCCGYNSGVESLNNYLRSKKYIMKFQINKPKVNVLNNFPTFLWLSKVAIFDNPDSLRSEYDVPTELTKLIGSYLFIK